VEHDCLAFDVPALGHGGISLELVVELHERVEDVGEDLRRRRVRRQTRIEQEL
jgi:hypothetical protein